MRHVFSSVDIGTDTIKIVVCELYRNKLSLLAASSVKTKGVKKGLITNVEEVVQSLKTAISEVESMLGIRIHKVIASVPSYFADFAIIKGESPIEGDTVSGRDVVRVLGLAAESKLSPNKEMVTILPIDFKVDDQETVKDPKGLTGNTLMTRAVLVTTPRKNIYSVISILESLGLEVVDISLNSIGDLCSFKNERMDHQVGAVINIGSETTNVSLYNKGIIVKNSVIGIGGKSIDNDIAYMYKINMDLARTIKEKFALAHKKYASVSDLFEVTTEEGTDFKINQFEVSEIVMSRVEEILTLAKKEINLLTNKEIEYIIVTGGTSNLAHIEYMMEEIFGKNARIGELKMMGVRNNKFSSAVGNIVYFINKLKLKGSNYTMISEDDAEMLSSTRKNGLNISNESMLGKVFGYFFGE